MRNLVLTSQRQHKRVETPEGVWALWKCGRTEDTSRVKNLGVDGLFVETNKLCPINATVELDFLVQDGEISARATVRFVTAGRGMGLQFKSVRNEHQERFTAMIKRLTLCQANTF